MMYCPKCNAEYVDGITMCSTCNVPLNREPNPPKTFDDREYEEPVLLMVAQSEMDCRAVCDILEQNGIPTMTRFRGGEYVRIYGVGHNLPVEIYVPQSMVEKAVSSIDVYIPNSNENHLAYTDDFTKEAKKSVSRRQTLQLLFIFLIFVVPLLTALVISNLTEIIEFLERIGVLRT